MLNKGDACINPEIERAVAAAIRDDKPVRAVVGDSTRVPAFFKQIDDLIVRYFRPDDVASFQQALDDLCSAHQGYLAVVCWETENVGTGG